MERSYRLVDVFTSRPLAGNPLAVFSETLEEELLQPVASELRLPETVFLAPPGRDSRRRGMRIFTPDGELPFAGHPTLGTAHVLSLESREEYQTWILEQTAGPVEVEVRRLAEGWTRGRLTLRRAPQFGPEAPAPDRVAPWLGLERGEVLETCFVGHGVPFLLVRVRDPEALVRSELDLVAWREHLRNAWSPHVALHAVLDQEHLVARVFLPGVGIPEDPATGAAGAALGAHLGRRNRNGKRTFSIEQGSEIRRPSRIEVEANAEAGVLRSVSVGGDVVSIGSGVLDLAGEASRA